MKSQRDDGIMMCQCGHTASAHNDDWSCKVCNCPCVEFSKPITATFDPLQVERELFKKSELLIRSLQPYMGNKNLLLAHDFYWIAANLFKYIEEEKSNA